MTDMRREEEKRKLCEHDETLLQFNLYETKQDRVFPTTVKSRDEYRRKSIRIIEFSGKQSDWNGWSEKFPSQVKCRE